MTGLASPRKPAPAMRLALTCVAALWCLGALAQSAPPVASPAPGPVTKPTTSAPAPASGAACVAPDQVTLHHLYGLWRAEFQGLAQGGTLLLERHRELSESFSGTINRNGDKALLSGDIDEGQFTMDESADGTRISATWSGEVVGSSCGREIRGEWRRANESQSLTFVLRKLSGWD